jgi:hypothetical protein
MEVKDTIIADQSYTGKKCTICLSIVIIGDEVKHCHECELPFHSECWLENKGCSQYGCAGATVEKAKDDQQMTDFEDSIWGDEKECPSCGKNIKARAKRCRYCKIDFDNRGRITKKEFSSREYTDSEFTKARNILIIFFFLSATGILSPVFLVLNSIFIIQGSLGKMQYSRVSSGLRALAVTSLAVSIFLTIMLLLFAFFDN